MAMTRFCGNAAARSPGRPRLGEAQSRKISVRTLRPDASWRNTGAPFARLLGIELFDAGAGRITMTLLPQEFHYNPMGWRARRHPQHAVDSVMSAAVHTALPRQGLSDAGLNITFLKPVYDTLVT